MLTETKAFYFLIGYVGQNMKIKGKMTKKEWVDLLSIIEKDFELEDLVKK